MVDEVVCDVVNPAVSVDDQSADWGLVSVRAELLRVWTGGGAQAWGSAWGLDGDQAGVQVPSMASGWSG